MIYLIILTLLSIAINITLVIYIVKLKKHFEYQIDEERHRLHQLEEYYVHLHKEYAEHMYKYH